MRYRLGLLWARLTGDDKTVLAAILIAGFLLSILESIIFKLVIG